MTPHPCVVLKFRKEITLEQEEEHLNVLMNDNQILQLKKPNRDYQNILNTLIDNGGTLDSLIEGANKSTDKAKLYFLIGLLERHCLISYSLVEDEVRLATLIPAGKAINFITHSISPINLLLSRFALLRREGFEWLLECPLSNGQLYINNSHLVTCTGLLATPQNVYSISKKLPQISPLSIEIFLRFLISMHAAFKCDDAGNIPEDLDTSLRQWEHHDLLFHYHSRSGRHDYGYGATFRFRMIIPHASAIRTYEFAEHIPLQKAEPEHLDCSFYNTIEHRRSKRERGKKAVTLQQVGVFLWHVARVKQFNPAEPDGYESTFRPVPGGGAMHEIDLYLTINRCAGLDQGIYHYNPLSHELEKIANLDEPQRALLKDAMLSADMSHPPDVLFTLAARFGRMAWKYQSIAYAVTLKNAGVLYNQMYLVATALGLAPCGLGGGNAEAFSLATNTSYYEEGSIGEFILSSCDDEAPN